MQNTNVHESMQISIECHGVKPGQDLTEFAPNLLMGLWTGSAEEIKQQILPNLGFFKIKAGQKLIRLMKLVELMATTFKHFCCWLFQGSASKI
jgi:hypothetical protein